MKNKFLKYLGPVNSLANYNKSYKLVLLKYIFESTRDNNDLSVLVISQKFRDYYLDRKKQGLISDLNADRRIDKVEDSSIKDIIHIIKVNPLNAINSKGFLNIEILENGKEFFSLNKKLVTSLNNDDYDEIIRIIDKKLEFYYSKIDKYYTYNQKMKNKSKPKKVLSPSQKLVNRINREFPKKKFIGDIIIDDEEHQLLIGFLKRGFDRIINSYNHIIIDPVFATALVQVGIRNYDNRFWIHVQNALLPQKMNVNHHKWICDSFFETCKKYNKLLLNKNDRMNNILMHGFVSDRYANSFFDFLFAYYRIDLERDLSRNTREMMDSLIEIIMRNDNTDRTYLLVKHTQDAVTNNVRGSKIRIRRFLKLIDKCFWGEEIKLNLNNRLSRLFSEWKDNSIEFKDEINKYNYQGSNLKGRKRFSSPYIKCVFKDTKFNLVFPPQVIKTSDPYRIKWRVNIDDSSVNYIATTYKVITGYKTEELTVELDSKDLFKTITIELIDDEARLRLFKIKKDIIRFFDKDGDLIIKDNLPEGTVYSFNEVEHIPISDALIDSEIISGLVRAYFELEKGDIIRLPDGTPISIGKKLDEGLLHRGLVSNVVGLYESNIYNIYKKAPSVMMKISPQKVNGTMISVNGNRHRMFDVETTILDLKDRSGETGYLINLSDLGCIEDGIYNIYIDVPNDRTNRSWQFILINGLSYEFEDAPYIFQSRGTIKFNENLKIQPFTDNMIKDKNENLYNFEIEPDEDEILFSTELYNSYVYLKFLVPAFKWSYNNFNWFLQNPSDIWHNDFPNKIYIKFPENKIILHMDDLYETDINQSVAYTKFTSTGIFECDITRFKSWLGREKKIRTILINLGNKDYEFLNVITRSYVTDRMIKADFINQRLIGEFDIVGNSNYYVDILLNGDIVVEKEPIIDGKISINNPLLSGRYKIIIFEEEDDGTGFGFEYLYMFEFNQELINPYDLTGKKIELKFIKNLEAIFKIPFKEKYFINNLNLINPKDRHNYIGRLEKISDNTKASDIPVKITFNDLNNLKYVYISFLEDDEYIAFLFDEFKKRIVTYEEEGLRSSVRYRRYTVIYDDEYTFGIEFS